MQQIRAFEGRSAWRRADFSGDDWIENLTTAENEELRAAALALPEDEALWMDLTPDDISIVTLRQRLARVTCELDEGVGFALLRGIDLPPDNVDYAYRVNWVLALLLGDVIAQNAKGELIGAVQDEVKTGDNGLETRGYVSNAELRFHCHGGDVASLLCVRQAPEGGESALVSMVRIHNDMLRECPEHLETLYRGMEIHIRAEQGMASDTMPRQSIFMPQQDHMLAWCNLRIMELPYEAKGEAMPAAERAALDALEEIAERPENKFSFKMQPGDMFLTHNFICMHKRSAFVDDPAPNKNRFLLRLWYNIRGGRTERALSPDTRKGYFTKAPYVIRHKAG
jgi:hypothetical protein